MKARIFNVMQYERNPETGEDLHFNENNIKECLEHKTIKKWAYILHDKDVYSEKDESDSEGLRKAGDLKPPHWHVVVQVQPALDTSIIAKWLGIPENFVDVPKGRGAFLDCVEYLTHSDEDQQAQGKHLYGDEEVKASFDWKSELLRRDEIRAKYHKDELSPKEEMRLSVLLQGKTLKQVQAEDPALFLEDESTLRKARATYLSNMQPPALRINYYIEGQGGVGKGTLSRILAKSLFPNLPDDECYFETGASGVMLDGYDGQPVIIWHDKRAAALLKELGGRGNVFNVFDTHPPKIRQNVKFSHASMVNAVNIVNGVESYEDFLDGLAGEYTTRDGTSYEAEDKNQAYRRFPLIICLRESDFDVLVNMGFAYGTFEFEQYIKYKSIQGNFGKVMHRLSGAARDTLLLSMTEPIVREHRKLEEKENDTRTDEIPEDMKDYGKTAEELGKESGLPFL